MLPSYYSGLDLGQSQDYTALAVLERTRKEGKCHFSLRHLQRFALGTRYTAVCDSLKTLFSVKPLGGTMLSVDATGVGKPVVDMIKGAKIRAQLKPIVITAGHAATFTDGAFHVPKKELVSTLQVLLQSRRLRIAEDLAEAKALVEELANFKVKVTTSANETFELSSLHPSRQGG
jgi:hypothetical protein